MKLEILRRFITIAEEKNMTRAASLLHVAQSTLSRQIADLEAEYEVILFDRSGKHLILTDEGRLLLARAREIVQLTNKTEREIRNSRGKIHGDLHISAGETLGMSFIARVISKIRAQYPDVFFHLYSEYAQASIDKLDSGAVDFALVIDPIDKLNFEAIHLPGYDQWGIIIPKDHPLAAHEFVTKEDLIHEPLILSRQKGVSSRIANWFGRDYAELNIIGSFNLMYNASLFVKENVGIQIGFKNVINTNEVSDFAFVPLKPTVTEQIYLIWKKGKQFSPVADLFLETLRQEIQEDNQ